MGKSLSSDSARARSQKQKERRDVQRRTRGSASLPAPAEREVWSYHFYGALGLLRLLVTEVDHLARLQA